MRAEVSVVLEERIVSNVQLQIGKSSILESPNSTKIEFSLLYKKIGYCEVLANVQWKYGGGG